MLCCTKTIKHLLFSWLLQIFVVCFTVNAIYPFAMAPDVRAPFNVQCSTSFSQIFDNMSCCTKTVKQLFFSWYLQIFVDCVNSVDSVNAIYRPPLALDVPASVNVQCSLFRKLPTFYEFSTIFRVVQNKLAFIVLVLFTIFRCLLNYNAIYRPPSCFDSLDVQIELERIKFLCQP